MIDADEARVRVTEAVMALLREGFTGDRMTMLYDGLDRPDGDANVRGFVHLIEQAVFLAGLTAGFARNQLGEDPVMNFLFDHRAGNNSADE